MRDKMDLRSCGKKYFVYNDAIEDPKHARRDTFAALLRVASKTHF